MDKIFRLYYNKDKMELTIEPCNKYKLNPVTNYKIPDYEEIYYWNSNTYVSENKKELKRLANDLKNEWILELEERLNILKQLKVKIKY